MYWSLIFFFVMGLALALTPTCITKNVKKAIETENRYERDRVFGKVSTWTLVYAWVVIITVIGFLVELGIAMDKKVEEINSRIERVEEQINLPPTDTLYVIQYLPENE